MCHSNCPYERWSGECKGRGNSGVVRAQPYCMDKEDFEAFVESYDDGAILDYDLDVIREEHNFNP